MLGLIFITFIRICPVTMETCQFNSKSTQTPPPPITYILQYSPQELIRTLKLYFVGLISVFIKNDDQQKQNKTKTSGSPQIVSLPFMIGTFMNNIHEGEEMGLICNDWQEPCKRVTRSDEVFRGLTVRHTQIIHRKFYFILIVRVQAPCTIDYSQMNNLKITYHYLSIYLITYLLVHPLS